MRKLSSLIYDERDFVAFGEVARFVFVKGNCIFVYGQDTDPSPLYVFELGSIIAIQEDPKHPEKSSFTISPRLNTNEARENLVTILLKDSTSGQQLYQITFDTSNDKTVAMRFMDVLQVNAKYYGDKVIIASLLPTKTDEKTMLK